MSGLCNLDVAQQQTPEQLVEDLGRQDRARLLGMPCFMGISLSAAGSGLFSKNNVEAYCNLLNRLGCPSFLIVVADSLERFNYQHFRGLSATEALETALRVGREYTTGYERIAKKYSFVKVVRASELQKVREFYSYLAIIQSEFEQDCRFREDVKQQVKANLDGKLPNTSGEVPRLLCSYLLEELALCALLYEARIAHYPVQISPRLDPLLEKVFTGVYPSLHGRLSLEGIHFHYLVLRPWKSEPL